MDNMYPYPATSGMGPAMQGGIYGNNIGYPYPRQTVMGQGIPGKRVAPFPTRKFVLFGYMVSILSAATLALGVANTVYTYQNYGTTCSSFSGIFNLICPSVLTYITVGVWASIPIFITGLLALKIGTKPSLRKYFKFFCFLSVFIFAPALLAITALELASWMTHPLTANVDPYIYFNTNGMFSGPALKFVLPLLILILGGIIMVFLVIAALYIYNHRIPKNMRQQAGRGLGQSLPAQQVYYGDGGYGNVVDPGYGMGMGGYGGDNVNYEPEYGDDAGGFGAPMYLPDDGGQDAVQYTDAAPAAIQPAPAAPNNSTSNNNNNNIVIPPIIIPQAPAQQPYPMFMPQPQQQPIIIMAPSAAPAPAQPQPVFLPLPARRNGAPRPPPLRPVLRPYPPSRYYPQRRLPMVKQYAGPSYMMGQGSPFPDRG